MQLETIRRIVIDAQERGMAQLTGKLRDLAGAQGDFARVAEASATSTDKNAKTAERAARVFARENLKYDSAAKDLLALSRAYDVATAALQQGQTDVAGFTRLMEGATAATRRNKEVLAEQAAVAGAAAQAQIAEAARVDAAMAQYAAMAAKRQQDAIAMEERAASERQRNQA